MGGVTRRGFLGGVGASALLSGCALAWEGPLLNGCLRPEALPAWAAEHPAVAGAFEGLEARRLLDVHAHLLGIGDGGSGAWVNPAMLSWTSPGSRVRGRLYMNAACVEDAPAGGLDAAYVGRLRRLLEGMPAGYRVLALAFEGYHDASGALVREETPFHVPDGWARRVAGTWPERFVWAASIHPYREDAAAAVAAARAGGAWAVKWLPASMGIDPASPRCDGFYEALAASGMALLSHAGSEEAVAAHGGDLGNPLRLRRALERGVRVIVAHCASQGVAEDLDRRSGAPVETFALFGRMMEEGHGERLLGEVSGTAFSNRVGAPLARLVREEGWHGRLLYGSDYPLPGVMPLTSFERLEAGGFLTASETRALAALREHNPLRFDFALKRALRQGEVGFAASVFEGARLLALDDA